MHMIKNSFDYVLAKVHQRMKMPTNIRFTKKKARVIKIPKVKCKFTVKLIL